jgi:hypothetical protein
MKGNNVLQLNHQSMVEALQLYVNDEFAEGSAPEVTDVKFDEPTGLFNVVLTRREDQNQLRLPLQSCN